MSANLLDGLTPQLNNGTAEDSGMWHVKQTAGHADLLTWKISGQAALAANQTVHLGISAKAASGSTGTFSLVVAYMDAAGKKNWAWTTGISPTASWSRFEASATIPSGMTIYALTLSIPTGKKSPEAWVTAPTMSYGSPVCLASSAHTPYATQDHVSVTYATKASLKVTDDSVKAEVSARAQTDRMVSEVSSRLTQTASGLSASISKLSETDEKVNAWFDFEADSSGNPQLKMGSSTSPVVGRYTNSGLAYMSRDGATIMELDASRSATISDHMEAQDMKLGKWRWVQTQDGTHLTLVWAG